MNRERLQMLREDIEKLWGPTEVPDGDKTGTGRVPGMKRYNEPESLSGFTHPETPTNAVQIAAEAAEKATTLNLNIGTCTQHGETIKGIAGLTLEAFSKEARAVVNDAAKNGITLSTKETATKVLDLDEVMAGELFNGPSNVGSERAWITPEAAARAVTNVMENKNPWTDLDIGGLKEQSRTGEDYERYFAALAERENQEPGKQEPTSKSEVIEAYKEAFKITRIQPTADVHRLAHVGRGAQIGSEVRIEAEAKIGTGARIDAGAEIARGARVARNGHVCSNAQIQQYARVNEVGPNAKIYEKAECPGRIGADCKVGTETRIYGDVGARSTVKPYGFVEATLGSDVHIGRRACIGSGDPAGTKERQRRTGPRRETVIADGSRIGNRVNAPQGWNCDKGPVTIGDDIAMPKRETLDERVPIPNKTEFHYADEMRSIITSSGVPAEIHPTAKIDPTAVIEPGVRIGRDVQIGAGTKVEAGAVIGDGTSIDINATVRSCARVGPECRIQHHASVGIGAALEERTHLRGYAEVGARVRAGKGCNIAGTIKNDSNIGEGTVTSRRSIVGERNDVGPYAELEYGAETGRNCELGINARAGGFARIGEETTLGAGAVVGHESVVEDHVTIGTNGKVLDGGRVERHCLMEPESTVGRVTVPPYRHVPATGNGLQRNEDARALKPRTDKMPMDEAPHEPPPSRAAGEHSQDRDHDRPSQQR